jgi:dUTP diphosphatase|nr:MAG TPA: deoxyuridine 5'-triphosphate nucleotidohydrolase [Caudoviricetes sp.]
MQEVKIVLEGGVMPKKATEGAACYDLYVPEDFILRRGRQIVPLGFRLQLLKNMAAIVKSRSGFASNGIEVMYEQLCELYKKRLDADVLLGTVDSDYTGIVGVIIDVHEELLVHTFIAKGTRIAQMQIVEVPETEFKQVDSLDETERGDGGFGHTGVKEIVKQSEKPKKKAGRPRKK